MINSVKGAGGIAQACAEFLFSARGILFLLFMGSCATYRPQQAPGLAESGNQDKEVAHTVYLTGGWGNDGREDETLIKKFQQLLGEASEKSTLIFTGDNISEEIDRWSRDKKLLDRQLNLTKSFKGQTLYLPGNNEWKSYQADRMQEVEEYLDSVAPERVQLLPKNGCPLEHMEINEQLDLILIDSKWFISNWSRVKDINKECTNLVTRRRFAEELEGYINDGQDKNIIIAMHHPVFSNGKYAGKETLGSHLTPLPFLGTLWNGIEDMAGFSPDRLGSRRYNYLRILVSALSKESDRITILSGHEESLQLLSGGDIHQIISGSLQNKTATRRTTDRITTVGGSLPFEGKFTYGAQGFSKLEYFQDGSSRVTFYTAEETPYSFDILPKLPEPKIPDHFVSTGEKTREDAVLENPEELKKSGFYRFFWGERYRKYFGTTVTAPVAMLDTLYGGLKVTKEGGGHQSYSIRLEDEGGKEYSMRSLRKNALKFLKFKVKGVAYTADEYENTWAEEMVSDFFTTAHPYMQLVINPLARAVNVNHSSPSLFYIPKQEALGELNEAFGNELYFIEERPSDEQLNFRGYKRSMDASGKIRDFESTTDMLEKIKSDESYVIAERDFIRARVFDMLIGDWDRHQDQWRWAEYESEEGLKEFIPIPRDRDNAFPRFDGLGMDLVQLFVPASRRWQSYAPGIPDIKWFNIGGNKIDRALLTQNGSKAWEEEAQFIKENLSREQIEAAFMRLPAEVRDSTSREIMETLQKRLDKLPEFALAYGRYLDKLVSLHASEKDDKIEVTRLPGNRSRVVCRRLLSDKPDEVFYDRTFNGDETEEVWIYGLGDKDIFTVAGEEETSIFIRLIGGYGEDTFDIKQKASLKVYDWKHETTHFEDQTPARQLTDIYETNTNHWRFYEPSNNILVPTLGFRTDDGIFLGARNTYTYNGFNGNPFRQQHSLGANYYFKFGALELDYRGIFGNIFPKWNMEAEGYYATNRFSNNFFGLGNESINMEDQLGRDFYRSRMAMGKFSAGLAYHTLRFKALYESFKVMDLQDRLFTPENLGEEVFDHQHYAGLETSLYYENDDANDFPAKAIYFGLSGGYKTNLSLPDNAFGYLTFKGAFSHKLIPSGDLVLGSTAEVKTNFGDNYFYYHAPSLGGNNGLRGFRDERFTAKTYFYQSSDLRWRVLRVTTPVAPVTMGIYGGFDYGRVWQPEESSDVWHTSQGIGLWVSGADFLAVHAGFFNSVEGNMVQVGFGFGF